MPRQVLTLSGTNAAGWSGAALIDPTLIEGGGTAYLRHIRPIGNSIQVLLSAAADGDADAAGPEFTGALEGAESAFTFDAGGASLTLKGPGHAGNVFADPSEPYYWTPDNGAEMNAWFAAVEGDVTLALDDGVVTHAMRGTATAGAPAARAWVAILPMPTHAIRGQAAAGAAQARARVALVPALALSDFDAAGLDLDALALIRAGAGADDTIYASPPRGAVGTLLDGELGLGETEAAITRITRLGGGTMLLINDNAPPALRDYFSPGGAGADLRIHIQTRAGVASIPVMTHGDGGGNYIQFGPLGSDLQTITDGIAEGERFIIAFARPERGVVAVRGAAAAGAPEAAARVRRVTPPVRAVRGTAAAGAPQARARPVVASVRTIRGTAAAGAPQARARPVVASVRTIRGAAVAGAPGATLHLVRVLPPALRFAHSLRASAPGDALLTALEIEHPAAAQPVRVINDTRNRRIEGAEYVALRFDAKLADDIGGQVPQAELGIDNVGRELTQWIEATGGGVGATVRVMLVLDIEDPPVEWEVTLDVASMAVDQERVTARLGFDPLLGRAAVALRHDPQTSPGLF